MKNYRKEILLGLLIIGLGLFIIWFNIDRIEQEPTLAEQWNYDFWQTSEQANKEIERSQNIALIIDYEIKELEKKDIFVHDTFKWKCQNYLADDTVRWIQMDIIWEQYCFIIFHIK